MIGGIEGSSQMAAIAIMLGLLPIQGPAGTKFHSTPSEAF